MKKWEFISITKLPITNKNKFEVELLNMKTDEINKIKFGSNPYEHYTSGHLDERRKRSYINRHKKRENWSLSGVNTKGFWAYHFLWKYKTYNEAMKNILLDYF